MSTSDSSKGIQIGAAIQDVGDIPVGNSVGGIATAKAVQIGGVAIGGQVLETGRDGIPRWTFGQSCRVSACATGGALFSASDYTTFTSATTKTPCVASVTFKDLVLTYLAIKSPTVGQSEVPFSNDFEIRASIEYLGVLYPLFFPSGKQIQLMKPGLRIDTIPLGIEIPAGAQFWVRTWCNRIISNTFTASNGEAGNLTANQTNFPRNITVRGSFAAVADGGGVSFSSSTGVDPFLVDFTNSGSVAASANEGYAPYGISGTPSAGSARASILFGDSISMGTGDVFTNATGGIGWQVRALKSLSLPYLHAALGGETAGTVNGVQYVTNRFNSARRASTAIVSLGTNDLLTTPLTAAQLQTQLLSIRDKLLSRVDQVIFSTIIPRATSTDNFLTVRNQSPVTTNNFNAQRILFNNWLRGSGLPFLEAADKIESARDSGVYKAPNVAAESGTSTAFTSTVCTDTSKSWTTNQWVGYTLIVAGQASEIISNTSNALTLYIALSPTPGATTAYTIAATNTYDGTHPTAFGHDLMSISITERASLIV